MYGYDHNQTRRGDLLQGLGHGAAPLTAQCGRLRKIARLFASGR